MICLTSTLVMNVKPIKQQRYELDKFEIPNIYQCGSMEFPGIAIDAEKEATAIMTRIMMNDNTLKAICSLNRKSALSIDKHPLWRSFLDAGSNPDSAFIFYESFFTSCFN